MSGAPRWFEDLSSQSNWLCDEQDDDLGVNTALAVPVWWRSDVVGVVALFSDEPVDPDPHTLELVEQVVTQIGAAVHRFSTEAGADVPDAPAPGASAGVSLSASASATASMSGVTESLGHVAHHVRTPLNGLIGNLELLCETALPSDAKDLAGRALQSAVELHARFETWLVDADVDAEGEPDASVAADPATAAPGD